MRDRYDERRKYEADVEYEVWRSGGNPDCVNPDRVEEHFYNGDFSDSAAAHEMRMQRRPQEPEEPEEEYPEYPYEQEQPSEDL